jgi:endonuclease YncB( thermonuclease family)
MSSVPKCLEDCTNSNTQEVTFNQDVKQAKVVDAYDGDTIKVCFAFAGKFYKFPIRMLGYNCAEMKPPKTDPEYDAIKAKAIAARDYLRSLILGKVVFIQCFDYDKYGRILANVYLDHTLADQVCVNQMMIANGHGKPYTGVGAKEY